MAKNFDIERIMDEVNEREQNVQRERIEERELLIDSFRQFDNERLVRVR